MCEIKLGELNKDNWKEAIKLEVSENQKSFVSTNVYSIAEATFHDGAFFRGIFCDEKMIGFTLLFTTPEEPEVGFIPRFMIDKNHQRNGYGKKAMECIYKIFREMNKETVSLTVIPENDPARKMYESVGFVNTNKMVDGELKYLYKLEI